MKNHANKLLSVLVTFTLLSSPPTLPAAEIRKANSGYPLEWGASWIGGVVPGDADIAVWDKLSGGAMSSVTTNTSWAGIAIQELPDWMSELQFSVWGGFPNPTNTLTLGAAGIDMSLATVDVQLFTADGHLELGTNQTWMVGPQGRRLTMACTNDGPGSLTKAGAGTLRLDYSWMGYPTDDSHINDSARLTLAGGTVELYGGTHPEIVGAALVAPGATRVIRNNGSATLVLNGLSRTTGGTVDFQPWPSSFVQTSSPNDASSGGGILGGWATCGADWAQASSGGGNQDIVPFPASGYSEDFLASNNVNLANSMTLTNTTAVSINSLRFGPGLSPEVVLTVGTNGGYPLTVLSGGILSVAPWSTIQSTSPARTLRGPAGGDLIFNVLGGFLTNKIVIANNAGSGLTKSGGGTLILNPPGNNTYTGTTRINEGTLMTGSVAGRRYVSSSLFIDGGFNWGPPPFGPLGVAALFHGPTNDHLNGVNIVMSGGMLHMNGQVDSCNTLVMSNNATLSGYAPDGWLTVTNRGSNAVFATSGTVDAMLNDWGGLTKSGAGTLVVQRDSWVYGPTMIESGTLCVGGSGTNGLQINSTLSLNSLELGSSSKVAEVVLGNANGMGTLVVTNLIASAGSRIRGSTNGGSGGGTLILDFDYDTNFNVGLLGSGIYGEGNVTLVKTGPGTLTLNGLGGYGSTIISNCLVKVDNAGALPPYGGVVLANGTLDLGGFSQSIGGLNGSGLVANSGGALTLTILSSGGGFTGNLSDGNGTVSLTIGNYASQALEGANTFTGDTVINATGSIYLSGSTRSGMTTVYGRLDLGNSGVIGSGWGGVNLAGGTLWLGDRTAALPNPISVTANSFIGGGGSTGTVAISLTGPLSVTGGTLTFASSHYDQYPSSFEPRLTAAFTCNNPLVVTNDVHYLLPKLSTTRLGSFNTNGTTQTFNGPISGDGSFRRSASAGIGGVTVFNANNTYSGATLVDNGTLLVNGRIGTNIVTVTNLGILGGNGTIRGPVLVQNGGTLAPGTSIGRLTLSNALVFANGSTAFMEISKSGSTITNDFVTGLTSVTYGGTLSLTNLNDALAAGDSIKLFSATNYSGAFTNLVPTTPGAGLVWDTSSLTTNGTLKVAALPAGPLMEQTVLSGTNFIVSGSGGVTNGTYYVLTATNAAAPLTNWALLSTNAFDANGNFVFTNVVSPNTPQQYFRLQLP